MPWESNPPSHQQQVSRLLTRGFRVSVSEYYNAQLGTKAGNLHYEEEDHSMFLVWLKYECSVADQAYSILLQRQEVLSGRKGFRCHIQ
jgi:hypothetical protein